MAAAVILRPRIGSPIDISVTISETHELASQITDYPIETGSSISDHVQDTGIALTLNSLIDGAGAHVVDFVVHPSDAYDSLLELKGKKEVFTVITGLRTYDNMLFRRLSCTRDKDTGSVLSFTAELKQIQFATAGTVEVAAEVDEKGGGGNKDLGKKATKPAPKDAANKSRSFLKSQSLGLGQFLGIQ